MKKYLFRVMSAILCVCLIGAAFAGCENGTDAPLEGSVIDTGTEVELRSMSEDKDGNFTIITKRGASSSSDSGVGFIPVGGDLGDLYPGAVVKSDNSKITAAQKLIESEDLQRKTLELNVDIKEGDEYTLQIDEPNQETVTRKIRKTVNNQTGTAVTSVRHAAVDNSVQIEKQLGITDNDAYRIDYKAISMGKYSYMFAIFDQVYYSVNAVPQTAAELYNETVSQQALSDNGINNAETAEITSVDYGRRVVVCVRSVDGSSTAKSTLEASISNNGFTQTGVSAMYSIYVIGGSSGNQLACISNTDDVNAVNNIINSELSYNKDLTAVPLSYKMNYLKDGSQVVANKDTESENIVTETRKKVKITFDPATAYDTKRYVLYAKPIKGVNSDGSYKLGNWECLRDDDSTKNKTIYVSGKYAEFAFAFDITLGTDWPYNGIFWKADMAAPENMYIEWGGGVRHAWIEITVDGKRVVDESNCSSHDGPNYK